LECRNESARAAESQSSIHEVVNGIVKGKNVLCPHDPSSTLLK
jgi:hypothetical protein